MATIAIAGAVIGTAGSIYGGISSMNAAAANARLTRAQADATFAVSTYQNNLNKAVLMAQAAVADQNAAYYHQAARTTEHLGFEQETRDVANQEMQQSQTRAEYGSSGVQGDTGSPISVVEHQGYVAQLRRMDEAYQTNIAGMDKDWQGSLSTYQATLDRETAKQYDYANAMAKWSQQAAYAGASVQQSAAQNAAIGGMISSIGQSAQGIGQSRMWASKVPNPTNAG